MKTNIEGLLLKKTPYQDRHLIGHLLLRSGRMSSVLFYGGQGGGKKKKSTVLEVGHMLNIELSHSRSTIDLYRAKEWRELWVYKKIRNNHRAFYLLCLYLEIIQKIAPKEDLHDDNLQADNFGEGLFRVLSNAIFHLEERLSDDSKGEFDQKSELLIFLGKLLIELGIFPDREACGICTEDLKKYSYLFLAPEHGTFICSDCHTQVEGQRPRNGQVGRELWELLGGIANQKYQDLLEMKIERDDALFSLFHYFCFQMNFKEKDFKSLTLVL